MKKVIIISTFILLLMANPAFCGNLGRALGLALPQIIDNESKIKQMELQEREMKLREQENQRRQEEHEYRMRHEERTDFKRMNDCLNAGYAYEHCKRRWGRAVLY